MATSGVLVSPRLSRLEQTRPKGLFRFLQQQKRERSKKAHEDPYSVERKEPDDLKVS